MLAAIGVESMDDLLVDIPQSLRIQALELPIGLSELETMAQMRSLAARNRVFADRLTFRGGGVGRDKRMPSSLEIHSSAYSAMR